MEIDGALSFTAVPHALDVGDRAERLTQVDGPDSSRAWGSAKRSPSGANLKNLLEEQPTVG